MGCVFALISAISARFALFLVWIFTDRLAVAFRSGWEAVLGFIFLPYATLFYALVYAPGKGVDGFGWVIVALGLLFDLTSALFGTRGRRRRARRHQLENR
jgi:predicted permease